MNSFFFSFFFFLPVLIQVSIASTDNSLNQTFVERLREDFRVFELIENGSISGNMEYYTQDKVWFIDFKFWTNDDGLVKRWSLMILISEVEDDEHHNEYEGYRSINIGGRSYLQKNKKDYPPGFSFLHDFLVNGPQMYSLVDKWIQKDDTKHVFESEIRAVQVSYSKRLSNEHSNFRLVMTRMASWVLPLKYFLQLYDGNQRLLLSSVWNHIQVINSNSEHKVTSPKNLFKLTDEFVFVKQISSHNLPSSTLLGLWGLILQSKT